MNLLTYLFAGWLVFELFRLRLSIGSQRHDHQGSCAINASPNTGA